MIAFSEQYRRVDIKELEQELAEIEAEKLRLDELAKAYALVAKHRQSKQSAAPIIHVDPVDSEQSTAGHEGPYGPPSKVSKSILVRDAIKSLPPKARFTLEDIVVKMFQNGITGITRTDVSFVLSRLRDRKEIFTVEQGAGKIPSIYSTTDPRLEGLPILDGMGVELPDI